MDNKYTEAVQQLKALREQKEQIIQSLRKDAKLLLEQLGIEYLKLNPYTKAVMITGYTPGFNDGEPCTHDTIAHELSMEEATKLGWSIDDIDYVFELLDEADCESRIEYDNDLLESLLGTNWRLRWMRKENNTFVFDIDEKSE